MNEDGRLWQEVVEGLFGGRAPAPEPLPTHELTDRERELLRSDCRCWVDPMKFTIYKNAVIRYVVTHRSGFDYPCCYGIYENPQSVLEAILNSEEHRNYLGWNAKMPSVYPLVNSAIRAGVYTFAQSDYVKSQCEMAIDFYHKTGGTNRL